MDADTGSKGGLDLEPELAPTMATMETAAVGMDEGERVRCALLHEKLTSHALAWPFLAPVDPVALNVPTYFDVISDPMDFGTMGKKLAAGAYGSPDDYRSDLVLMFENAIEFNKDDLREESVAYVSGKGWQWLWCDGRTDRGCSQEHGASTDGHRAQ